MVDKIWYNMEELIGGSEERGINRNIVECKEGYHSGTMHDVCCINRNIVECKDAIKAANSTASNVLIET